ncbi:MAG: hypothetical protein ABJG42_24475 [Vibrio splendidus]
MNNNERRIAIIRESIVKVTRILTGKGLRVTQAGVGAFVEYHKVTLEPIRVNIPYLPDDASDELIRAIEGFLDHEVGHLIFTDARAVKKAHEEKIGALHNIVEDVFVERMMSKKFSGSAYNLQNMYCVFTDKFIEPKLAEIRGKATEKDYWRILVACAIRALGGQRHFIEFMSDKWCLISEIHDAIIKFEKQLRTTRTSFENLELAHEIRVAVYGEKKPEMPKKSEEPKDKTPDEPDFDDKDDMPEESEPSSAPSHEDEDEPEEDFDDEDFDDEPSEEGREDDSELSEDSESFDDEEEMADDLEDDEESASFSGEDEDEDFEDKEEPILEEDESGKSDDLEDDEEIEDREPDKDEAEDEASETHTGVNPEEDSEELRESPLAASDEQEDFESMDDFDDAVSDIVSEMAKADSASSVYAPFTKDWDEISEFEVPDSFDEYWVKSIESKVSGMTGTLQKGLERAFKAANKSRWEGGKKRGRINSGALTRLLNNDARVFRTREETKTKDVAVSLLIDCSGSMGGNRIHTATEAAWALAEVLNKLGITFEVLGFTTQHSGRVEGGAKILDEMRSSGMDFDRLEPIYIPIFKAFNERFGIEPKRRMASITKKHFLMNNVDGESLQYAAERLRRQKEPGKTLIVLSDGQPAAHGNAHRLRMHLKSVVRNLEKEGINTVGIGIQTRSVCEYFKKSVVLNRVEDLPTEVMHQLRDAIMQKA